MSVSTHSVPDDGARAAGKVVGSGADGGNRGPNFTNAVGACASSAPLRKAGSPGDDTPLMPDICSEPGNVPTRILYHYLYADRQGFGLSVASTTGTLQTVKMRELGAGRYATSVARPPTLPAP